MSDQTELHERARELEDAIADNRAELDQIYSEISLDAEDRFLARVAERFRDERDQARRELAEMRTAVADLKFEDSSWEARFRALESRFLTARSAIGRVTGQPLMPRDQVQSTLLLAYEKIRDFNP